MKKLIKIDVYKDGGTEVWIEYSVTQTIGGSESAKKYYLDYRIISTTQGELFDRYPGDEGAIILDKSEFEFLDSD